MGTGLNSWALRAPEEALVGRAGELGMRSSCAAGQTSASLPVMMERGGPMQRMGFLATCFLLAVGILCADQKVDGECLAAQEELARALTTHFETLEPIEGVEARLVELRAGLDSVRASSAEGTLEPAKLARLEREIRMHSDSPDDYRPEFLRWVRLSARGERFPELRTRLGMAYRDVVIRRVTDVGLEVFHSTGTARLRHGDLPGHFQERFQWDEEEARETLDAEEKVDLEVKRLQINALERGLDPVVARLLEKSRLVLGEIESSARIVPAKLEPSGPLKLAELEPVGDLATRPLRSKKSK